MQLKFITIAMLFMWCYSKMFKVKAKVKYEVYFGTQKE